MVAMTVDVDLLTELQHLRRAMESRAVIEQAKGVLMFVFQLDADRAFQILARWSMQYHVKVRDLAAALIEISVPGAGAGGGDEAHLAVRQALQTGRRAAPAS